MRASARAFLIAVALAAALGGCGEDDVATPEPLGPQPGGALEIATTGQALQLDPLLADSFTERLVARQVSEPLLAAVEPPFTAPGPEPGARIATRATPSGGASVWRVDLRSGIRFQDGTRLDAAAVLANAARWQQLGGESPAAGVTGADSPRPGLVRFFLAAPDSDFPSRLAAPELGLVSPRAIRADGSIDPREPSGTGPFELASADPESIVLTRNAEWWGAALGLGPGLDELRIAPVADSDSALAALGSGQVRVAGSIDRDAGEQAEDPLAAPIRLGRGDSVVAERSVRGIETGGGVPGLSGAWTTDLGGERP